MRQHPLLRVTAAVTGLALRWGAFQAGNSPWAARHDNTPISSPSPAPSGALTVTGHGVTLTFPAGWVNAPTTPNKFAQFLRANAAKFPHPQAALKNQLDNMQNLSNLAMLVYRLTASGTVTGNTTVGVIPDTTPPGQLMPHLTGSVLGASLWMFLWAVTCGEHPGHRPLWQSTAMTGQASPGARGGAFAHATCSHPKGGAPDAR
jgi:hypothetical protein